MEEITKEQLKDRIIKEVITESELDKIIFTTHDGKVCIIVAEDLKHVTGDNTLHMPSDR